MWAWHEASKEGHHFELLSQAIQIGLQGEAEEWNVLNLAENGLHTKTLSPIRTMFERYSTLEFLERVPLLSRRFIREDTLNTDFSRYDDIKRYSSQGVDRNNLKEGVVQAWFERSREIIPGHMVICGYLGGRNHNHE
ncbi:hypothetical protein B0J12DRAFT_705352 [Macrophomina phaseolina]|uniref:Uncharacterized protein n=1 Tax=Macrophomina phaseolina TaxID=35725 RepID=A0ABQ8FSJ0_9PEZI|nr:hypothetical protein B0J12DRAFT_705352 [Macrophomina phaseolina]